MNPLPYEEYIISTPLAPAAIAMSLARRVRPQVWGNRWSSGAPYEGTVGPTSFLIQRITPWYSKARPLLILGEVQPSGLGSRIRVTLRPDWTQVLGLLVVFTVWPAFVVWRFSSLAAYVPILLLVAYLSVYLSFQWDARKAKAFLADALAGASADYDAPAPTFASRPAGTAAADPWSAGVPESSGYGWSSSPPPAPDPSDHETQRLPPAVRR